MIEHDFTQKKIAEELCMTKTGFNRKINKETGFKIDELKKMAKLFNCTIDDLID